MRKRIGKTLWLLIALSLFMSISQASAATFNIAGPAAAAVDTNPATIVSLNAAQTGIITDLNLYLSVDLPYADDLVISLIHGGIEVQIYNGAFGGAVDSYLDATFDDAAASVYPLGAVVGTFKPSPGLLSSFNGLQLSGLWELKIWDPNMSGDGNDLIGWSISGTTGGAGGAVIMDFNADGNRDILWRNNVTGQVAVWHMNGAALLGIADLPALPNPDFAIVGTGDFNGDGQIDILWRNNVTGQNAVWYMNGAALLGIADLPALPNPDYAIVGR